MLDALAYIKAARAAEVPVALEVSRSGAGAHAWLFFTSPVLAVAAREIGTGLLREAMALRGRMSLSSYDRLFPSQDVLQTGGPGNLIAAPLSGKARRRGTTVFLDLTTLEPHDDQWAYLSTLGRVSPRDADRLARRLGQVQVGSGVDRLRPATSTKITVQVPTVVNALFGAAITVATSRLPPRTAGDNEACGDDAQPRVLRTPAATRIHVGHPAVPTELRRNRQRRPRAAARPAGPPRPTHRPSRKQTRTHRRADRRCVLRVRVRGHPGSRAAGRAGRTARP